MSIDKWMDKDVRSHAHTPNGVLHACSVAQLCVTLCNPMDCSPPGSSVHEILQTRILEWVAISSSRGSSWPRDQTYVFYIPFTGRQILYHWAAWGNTMEYYCSVIKNNEKNAIFSKMDGPRDCYTKWSKLDRERQIPRDMAYVWNLK